VRRGDLGQRRLARQHPPYGRQVDAELAQRADQIQARDGADVPDAVAGRGAAGFPDDARIGVERIVFTGSPVRRARSPIV
jgi:hypothetical protein